MTATAAELEKLLNPEQLEAATTTEGPLLILAGAGSGKTRVLVHRIAHILEAGLARPWEIFAVTFTNKAAGEMRNRLAALLGPGVREAWIGTFHALSARMLRMEGHRLGYTSSFTIYDDDDAKRLLKTITEQLGIDTTSKGIQLSAIAHEIDRAKNFGENAEALKKRAERADHTPLRIAARVYPRYQDALRRSNAMDFGDLLVLAVELLRHHPEAHRRFSSRFRYVMVDEFQDTNKVQYELLQLLVSPHRNLAVVGDDDQAIYRWRGADVTNILGFEDTYPNAKVVKLERNYRSTANILDAANAVIRKNRHRHEKTLRTSAPPGGKVGVAMVQRSEDEAALVARLIADRIRRGERPEDFAILYRQNAQSRLFEESLTRARVPYVLIGGTGFYERMEVKDILAYLRLTANPSSRQDFERIVNVPSRKLGDKTLAKLRAAAEAEGLEGARMLELPRDAMLTAGIDATKAGVLEKLGADLAAFRELAERASAMEVAREIIERTGYLAHLRDKESDSADDRIANVQELVTSIAELEESLASEATIEAEAGLGIAGARTPLQAFLDSAALVSTNDEESRTGAVSMLTLHSAKGLEFPYVFMVGMEEQTFPSKRALESGGAAEMEEERRLCYVGMTRAMKELSLIAARLRRIYGYEEPRWPSRFLGELPDAIVGEVPGAGSITARGAPRRSDDFDFGDDVPQLGRNLRAVARGGDEIVYDDDAHEAAPPEREAPAPASDDPFRLGGRVFHNLYGEATIEDRDGRGPSARLTLRFRDGSTRRVVARFVRPL